MVTTAERNRLRAICHRLCARVARMGVKGAKLPIQHLVIQGHQFRFQALHWRRLGAAISRNPQILDLPPRLVAYRVVHKPDALETPRAQARKEALRAQNAYQAPIGQLCPGCGDTTLFVTFPRRSTGPGSKSEPTRHARCRHCGLVD